MNTFFDCIPCFMRQALDAARRATSDERIHEAILRKTLAAASQMDLCQSPPAMGYKIHRIVREHVDAGDPYREVKAQSNQCALELLPKMQAKVEAATDRLETAIRFAIAGNIIDIAVKADVSEVDVAGAFEDALHAPLCGDVSAFADAVTQAERILYLTDNAGEIVFDRLLIDELPREKITVAVRGGAVINDATLEDAQVAGLPERVRVIDNGADVPGTLLSECSPAFLKEYNEADLIIAKGQGNYETLSHQSENIFFLFKVKCPVIVQDVGEPVGSMMLHKNPHYTPTNETDATPAQV